MRSRFDNQLAELNRELIEMGAMCEESIGMALKALMEGDKALAKKVAGLDVAIDQKERSIESMCLKLLLQQQPVARDLRQISAALKMITDMERIGDQAEDIAEIITYLSDRSAASAASIPQRESIKPRSPLAMPVSIICAITSGTRSSSEASSSLNSGASMPSLR